MTLIFTGCRLDIDCSHQREALLISQWAEHQEILNTNYCRPVSVTQVLSIADVTPQKYCRAYWQVEGKAVNHCHKYFICPEELFKCPVQFHASIKVLRKMPPHLSIKKVQKDFFLCNLYQLSFNCLVWLLPSKSHCVIDLKRDDKLQEILDIQH